MVLLQTKGTNDCAVQIGEGSVRWNERAVPDVWTGAEKSDAQLVDRNFLIYLDHFGPRVAVAARTPTALFPLPPFFKSLWQLESAELRFGDRFSACVHRS